MCLFRVGSCKENVVEKYARYLVCVGSCEEFVKRMARYLIELGDVRRM